jgi:hypothetical protein
MVAVLRHYDLSWVRLPSSGSMGWMSVRPSSLA